MCLGPGKCLRAPEVLEEGEGLRLAPVREGSSMWGVAAGRWFVGAKAAGGNGFWVAMHMREVYLARDIRSRYNSVGSGS